MHGPVQTTLDESIDVLLGLHDLNMEQIRICQIVNALLTSSTLVRGEALAKTTVLCFRLYSSKVRTLCCIHAVLLHR